MLELVTLFAQILLPVYLTAGAGYALATALRIDARPLSAASLHVLAPCLAFQLIVRYEVAGDAFLRMASFALCCLLTLAGAAALIGRALGWPRRTTAAVALVVLLPNAGNLGLSTCDFAFGKPGLAQATMFFVTSLILTYTGGMLIATAGRAGLGAAARGLVRLPALWAVAAAFACVGTDVRPPLPLQRTIDLLADACVPVMLLVLGIQLRSARVGQDGAPLLVAVALRLLGGAALGLLLAGPFGLVGPARQAGVLEVAMPSAVVTTVLATEFDVEPGLVTSVVLVGTLLGPLTLTPLLALLGAAA